MKQCVYLLLCETCASILCVTTFLDLKLIDWLRRVLKVPTKQILDQVELTAKLCFGLVWDSSQQKCPCFLPVFLYSETMLKVPVFCLKDFHYCKFLTNVFIHYHIRAIVYQREAFGNCKYPIFMMPWCTSYISGNLRGL